MEKNNHNIHQGDKHFENIYCNGLEAGFTNSDAFIELVLNSEKIVKINLSFGTLKSLSEVTTKLVEDIELRTGKILSISEFNECMLKSLGDDNKGVENESS